MKRFLSTEKVIVDDPNWLNWLRWRHPGGFSGRFSGEAGEITKRGWGSLDSGREALHLGKFFITTEPRDRTLGIMWIVREIIPMAEHGRTIQVSEIWSFTQIAYWNSSHCTGALVQRLSYSSCSRLVALKSAVAQDLPTANVPMCRIRTWISWPLHITCC